MLFTNLIDFCFVTSLFPYNFKWHLVRCVWTKLCVYFCARSPMKHAYRGCTTWEWEEVINRFCLGWGINWDEHQGKEEILQIKFGCQFGCLTFKGKRYQKLWAKSVNADANEEHSLLLERTRGGRSKNVCVVRVCVCVCVWLFSLLWVYLWVPQTLVRNSITSFQFVFTARTTVCMYKCGRCISGQIVYIYLQIQHDALPGGQAEG